MPVSYAICHASFEKSYCHVSCFFSDVLLPCFMLLLKCLIAMVFHHVHPFLSALIIQQIIMQFCESDLVLFGLSIIFAICHDSYK
jgi:hypothetical protein